MLFEGEETFSYDVKDVWNALHDTALLARALPGCKSMTSTGNNTYAVAMSLGVAAVRGDYDGTVKVTDLKPLAHYMIEGEGKGAPGFVKLRMDCHLEGQVAGTLMKWKCDATVGGLIASIGGKALSGVSKYMAQQFFKSFKDELKKSATAIGDGAAVTRSSVASGVTSAPAGVQLPAETWFTRLWRSITRRPAKQ